MKSPCCNTCGEPTHSYDSVHYGDATHHRILCAFCYNATIAKSSGLMGFENAQFEPLELPDLDGVPHRFYFRYRLFVTGVSLDAFELIDGAPAGHQFRVYGEVDGDPFSLLGRLIEKLKQALSRRHLEETALGLQMTDARILRGSIGCDLEDPYRQKPFLVIDGKAISWETMGQILVSHEGWRFKLQILEPGEED